MMNSAWVMNSAAYLRFWLGHEQCCETQPKMQTHNNFLANARKVLSFKSRVGKVKTDITTGFTKTNARTRRADGQTIKIFD